MKTNKDKIVDHIYETTDYGKFKILIGNREIEPSRVAKIIASIKLVGFRNNPIMVNSKFEIVDGQGRFTALKALNMPVRYIIDETADINTCCALNINQKNWGYIDYIKSYATRGYKSYVRLLRFCEDYKQYFNLVTICAVCHGNKNIDGARCKSSTAQIQNGTFEFVGTDEEHVDEFEYLKKFTDCFARIGGTVDHYYTAILFAYRNTNIDRNRLVDKVEDLVGTMCKAPDVKTALGEITRVYNNCLKKDRVWIDMEYRNKNQIESEN